MPKRTDINEVLIIGSGPIVIGRACDLDYSARRLINVAYDAFGAFLC